MAVQREGKTELESLIERTRNLPPPGLDLPTNVKMPSSLTFRDAGSRECGRGCRLLRVDECRTDDLRGVMNGGP